MAARPVSESVRRADAELLRDREKLIAECGDDIKLLKALKRRVNCAKMRFYIRRDMGQAVKYRDFERELEMMIKKR